MDPSVISDLGAVGGLVVTNILIVRWFLSRQSLDMRRQAQAIHLLTLEHVNLRNDITPLMIGSKIDDAEPLLERSAEIRATIAEIRHHMEGQNPTTIEA